MYMCINNINDLTYSFTNKNLRLTYSLNLK